MNRRARRTGGSWLLPGLLAACAGLPRPEPQPVRHELPAPADVAAAVVAGALRAALPFADPVPASAGAPALRRGAAFAIAFALLPGGEWRAIGDHRLRIDGGDRGCVPRVVCEPMAAHERTDARPAFVLLVEPSESGCVLHGTMPATLAPAVDNACRLLVDPRTPLPGLAEPNLAAAALHRLRSAAVAAEHGGDPAAAHELRQVGADLGATTAALQARLGDDARAAGDVADARARYWQALLVSRDPGHRARLARDLGDLARTDRRASLWRRAAEQRLAAGDPDGARAFVHTARRERDDPSADYDLLARSHDQRADALAATASALLAREHRLATPDGWLAAGLLPALQHWLGLAARLEPVVDGRFRRGDALPAAPAR